MADDIQSRLLALDAAVRDAASAVDAARAAGDRSAELDAIVAMEAADKSRREFYRALRKDTDRRSMRNPNGF